MFHRIVYGRMNGLYNYSEFVCESTSDITNLPTSTHGTESSDQKYNICSVGSKATVIEDGKVYILAPNNEWVYYCDVNGGGSAFIDVTDDNNGNVTIV